MKGEHYWRKKFTTNFYFRGRLFFCSEIFESVNKKFNGKNPDWTKDRKNYDQVSPLQENLRKVRPKLRPKYVQTTTKEDRKS